MAKEYGIAVVLPDIPLWVPDGPKNLLNDLTLDTVRLALQYAAGAISDEAPVDSGGLAQSFGADPATRDGGQQVLGTDATAGITGRVFSTLPHAVVMDQGRRPGAPISRAGIDAIGLWAQRKLGLSAKEASRAKWAIAATIVARGLAPTGFFEHGVNKARPVVEGLFGALSGQLAALLVAEGRTAAGDRRYTTTSAARVARAGRVVRKAGK